MTCDAEGGKELSGDWKNETDRLLEAADSGQQRPTHRTGRVLEHPGRSDGSGLLVAAAKAGIDHDAIQTRFPRVAEAPFSSERKRMSTVHRTHESPEGRIVFAKGAPGMLPERCTYELTGQQTRPLTPARRGGILRATEALAAEALRTLGAAFRPLDPGDSEGTPTGSADEVEHDLVFLGLIGMIDPPRPEARAAVERAKAAGIRPILITGDHPGTAVAIARELGIASDDRVVSGAQLDLMSDHDLAAAAREVAVYARVNPQHKLRIVNALQSNGEIVAMTGDGVNDAPALKSADIGVAMGITGTDVSKEAADLVLTDDNFATIVAAVAEGRAVFDNIRKFLRYLLSSNAGEVLTVFFSVVLAGPLGLGHGGMLVLAAAGYADPLDQSIDRWSARSGARRRSGRSGSDEPASPRSHRRRHNPQHAWRYRTHRRGDGSRHAADLRCVTAGRVDRGIRRDQVRADHGVYDAGALSTVQRL